MMRIVMTGATSGIGLQAALALTADPSVKLAIGVRRPDRVPTGLAGRVDILPLDLNDLTSVKSFAAAVVAEGPIDAVIGNAGLQIVTRQQSVQGYERSFAVNHLAHYLLVRLLLPGMAADGRVILTSSGTHDPDQKTGIPAPKHADAARLSFPDSDPDLDAKIGVAGRRAYATSKLCNLMTIRELPRRHVDHPSLAFIAFDPGFVPGTGLARDYGPAVSWLFRRVLPLIIRGGHVSTARASGLALATLATDAVHADERGTYWSMDHGRAILRTLSALARDEHACATLWDDSARLVGLEP